ncbi:hypothetical protein ACA910_012002 [Epithemia clementina (nom. ined.)]
MSDSPARQLFSSLRSAVASSDGAVDAPVREAEVPSALTSLFVGFGLGPGDSGSAGALLSWNTWRGGRGGGRVSGVPSEPPPPVHPFSLTSGGQRGRENGGSRGALLDRGVSSPLPGSLESGGYLFVRPPIEAATGKVTFEEEERSVDHASSLFGSSGSAPTSASSVPMKVVSPPVGTNLVALVHLNIVEPTVCGAVIGTSGKFCLTPRAGCLTKSHKKALPGWQHALRQGFKLALFTQAPTTPTGPSTAFQNPFLDADKLSSPKLQELLLIRKHVPLWGGMFNLLEADPVDDAMEENTNNTGALDDNQPGTQRTSFIPKLENKYAAATTPAKQPLTSTQSKTIMSPPLMVLKDMGIDASSDEF